MISVVVVYNDENMFNDILRKSLLGQTVEYELIALDNTSGKFKSASEALNFGGNRATGKYIMFVHQDVDFASDTWLEDAEKILDNIRDLGIAGIVGMSKERNNFSEHHRGYINSSGDIWGRKIEKEEPVQTLDELLLIVPRSQFEKMKFDEQVFDHWHCYGADYCLSVRKMGLKAYVIPFFVYHRSRASNIEYLDIYQKRLFSKHKDENKYIYLATGKISWARLKFAGPIRLISSVHKKTKRYLNSGG